ncbi:MAG: helix-turn-helix domain-containing protein [Ruminococcus sp.]|nr:helix-turn-helix domain-containing protein [Ruminococcus sp.]MDE6787787.1 helix-turn-helix domain-containing protein [Ruminococcus sp.]
MQLDYKQIGKNLARRRKELRLKQFEVCERAEINDKYLSCIETARSIPSLEVFLRLCTALETTPDRILLGTVRQTDYSKDDTVLLEKFQTLSPTSKRLCLAFMDLLSDDFQNL